MNNSIRSKISRAGIIEIIALLLAFLFVYTGLSKVMDWEQTKSGLYNQVFPIWVSQLLLYLLPVMEITTAILLVIPKFRALGLRLSVILLACFTLYILLILTGIFGRIPCSCGGVIDSLGWWEHLVFNLVFLGMGVWGMREEGSREGGKTDDR